MPHLTIVPVANIAQGTALPDPALHIFYDMRVCDAVDDVPRHSGYMRSQLAFSAALLRGMRGSWASTLNLRSAPEAFNAP